MKHDAWEIDATGQGKICMEDMLEDMNWVYELIEILCLHMPG